MESHGPLPFELQEAIIDAVSRDTLKACNLTCRAWSAHSRKRLFENVFLSMRNVDGFIDLFLASPDLAHLVRWLVCDTLKDTRSLPLLATHLTQVRHLTLLSFKLWDSLGNEARETILNGFPLVDRLTLSLMVFNNTEVVAQLLSAFPLVKHLQYKNCATTARIPDNRFNSEPVPSALEHLRTLKVFDIDIRVLINWVLTLHPLPPIESVEFTGWRLRDLTDSGLHTLLRRLGSFLKSLSLGITFRQTPLNYVLDGAAL